MKQILITALAILVTMAFVGCSDSGPSYISYYVYKSKSSRNLTFTSYSRTDDKGFQEKPEYTFDIPVGGSFRLRFDADGDYLYPFYWQPPYSSDYVIIS